MCVRTSVGARSVESSCLMQHESWSTGVSWRLDFAACARKTCNARLERTLSHTGQAVVVSFCRHVSNKNTRMHVRTQKFVMGAA